MQTRLYFVFIVVSVLVIGVTFGKPATTSGCPPGQPQVYCFANPCSTSACPGDPSATCTATYCGTCNAVWKRPNGSLAQCGTKDKCQAGQGEVQCTKDPCKGASCQSYPRARCVANYCLYCHAEWYNINGGRITCKNSS